VEPLWIHRCHFAITKAVISPLRGRHTKRTLAA
jgi:hypothetical protein